ncbi:TlyA family RNA methyltransferase [Candidatus Saccharibacteria bacterium]|nr:TlyA family RNA methyltransferase [Candidatus Saccharibacteria bacterium]
MHTENAKNRGYYKIEGAVSAFDFDFRGKTVLDIGSSTGGFTEIALERGAVKVIAVEKGTRQMKAPLRYDPRVELYEKTDIFDFELLDKRKPDVIVADVSFLSLTKILKYAKIHLSRRDTEYLVMLKPQFEASEEQLVKGVVKNEKVRRDIIKRFEVWLKQNDFVIMNKRDNVLAGKNGNVERFYYLMLAKK